MGTAPIERSADNKVQLNNLPNYVRLVHLLNWTSLSICNNEQLKDYTQPSNNPHTPIHKISIIWKVAIEIRYSIISINDTMVILTSITAFWCNNILIPFFFLTEIWNVFKTYLFFFFLNLNTQIRMTKPKKSI